MAARRRRRPGVASDPARQIAERADRLEADVFALMDRLAESPTRADLDRAGGVLRAVLPEAVARLGPRADEEKRAAEADPALALLYESATEARARARQVRDIADAEAARDERRAVRAYAAAVSEACPVLEALTAIRVGAKWGELLLDSLPLLELIAEYVVAALRALLDTTRAMATEGGSLFAQLAAAVPERVEPERSDVRRAPRLVTAAAAVVRQPDPDPADVIPLARWPLGELPANAQPYLLPPAPVLTVGGPLAIADAAGIRSLAPGRGAPLAQRLFIELLLAVPRPAIEMGSPVTLRLPLRDLARDLWPGGARTWDRTRDLPRIAAALAVVHNATIGYRRADGRLAPWQPIAVRTPLLMWEGRPGGSGRWVTYPAPLDYELEVDVRTPADGQFGPRVHVPTLRALGLASGPAYRAYLSLAWHWFAAREPSGYGVEPSALDGRDLQRWPVLGPRDLAALCFPADAYRGDPKGRQSVERSRDTLIRLARPGDELPGAHGAARRVADDTARGLIRIEPAPGGVRLLPTNRQRAIPRLLAR